MFRVVEKRIVMNIQGVIKACSKRENLFARPQFWKGSGEAIDLGHRMDSESVRRIQATKTGAFLTTVWNILPAELLCSWEVISLTDLTEEVKRLDARKNRQASSS